MNNNNNENNTLEISSDNKNKQTLIVSTIILTFLFMIISIYNLFNKKINIEVNGNISEVSTFTNTIAKAIKEKNINLDKDDFINIKHKDNLTENADLNTKLKDDMYIEVIRVSKQVLSEYKDIEFETKVEEDEDLLKGETRVVQEGQNGTNKLEYNVVYHNGDLVNRSFSKEVVVKAPVDKIVKNGIKVEKERVIASNTVVKKESSSNVKTSSTNINGKHIKSVATAYSGGGKTATGTVPKWGTIAVDPKVIPYGTKVYIPQFNKTFIAEDCGGAIKGNKIDIYMNSKQECINWGRRTIDIYIVS